MAIVWFNFTLEVVIWCICFSPNILFIVLKTFFIMCFAQKINLRFLSNYLQRKVWKATKTWNYCEKVQQDTSISLEALSFREVVNYANQSHVTFGGLKFLGKLGSLDKEEEEIKHSKCIEKEAREDFQLILQCIIVKVE